MKKTTSIFILTFYSLLVGYSQKPQVKKTSVNADLVKFVGTWEYSNKQLTFKVTLKLGKLTMKGFTPVDILEGYYSLVENGKLIQESKNGEKVTILNGTFLDKKTKNKISLLIDDVKKNKLGDVTMEFQEGQNDSASWIVKNREGVRVGKFDTSFSVPTHLTLKKVQDTN